MAMNHVVKESDQYGFDAYYRPGASNYQTQYAHDYNHLQHIQQQKEAYIKRIEEEERAKLYQDKSLTYADYSNRQRPPNRINDASRYFESDGSDQQELQKKRSDEEYFANFDPAELMKHSIYSTDYKNPRKYDPNDYYKIDQPSARRNYDIQADYHTAELELWDRPTMPGRTYDAAYKRHLPVKQDSHGGFCFIRFAHEGLNTMKLALTGLQTVLASSEGLNYGIAKADWIFLKEGRGDWNLNDRRRSEREPQTRNCMAVLWFSSPLKCQLFMSNKKFKDFSFPTARHFEYFYLPLNSPRVSKGYPTFLLIELFEADKYDPKALSQFEADLRSAFEDLWTPDDSSRGMKKMKNLPLIISEMRTEASPQVGTSRMPGRRKTYVSRFERQSDVDYIWKREIIRDTMNNYNLNRGYHVSSFSLHD